ncbi:MAG: sigma-70 family RNA polymerase sigma factor [Planctomycetota bacterium]
MPDEPLHTVSEDPGADAGGSARSGLGDFCPEQLLEHAHWVRHLAEQLLDDPGQADDVVQDVWRAALLRPPRSSAVLVAWLRTVVRRLSFRVNRERRRAARLPSQLRPQAATGCGTQEAMQLRDCQMRLARALERLREPYRTVLLLRFYDEYSHADIGAALATHPSTVRTWQERGLKQLRAILDADDARGAPAWHGLLALLVANAPTAGEVWHSDRLATRAEPIGALGGRAATTATPAIRTWRWRLTSAVALPTVLIGGLFVGAGREASERVGEPGRNEIAVGRSSGAVDATSEPASAVSGLAPAPTRPSSPAVLGTSEPIATASIAADAGAWAIVRIEDATTGTPVEGANVFVHEIDQPVASLAATTDDVGEARVARSQLSRSALLVVAAGYREHRAGWDATRGNADVHCIGLDPIVSTWVYLSDPAARPIVGATVSVTGRTPATREPQRVAFTSDAQGRVALRSRFAEPILEIECAGYETICRPLETPEMRLTLRPALPLAGRVVDANAQPVPFATILVSSATARTSATSTCTDEVGRYEAGSVHPEELLVVTVRRAGFPAITVDGPAHELAHIQLPAVRTIAGRVRRHGPNAPAPAARAILVTRTSATEVVRPQLRTGTLQGPEIPTHRAPNRLQSLLHCDLAADGSFELCAYEGVPVFLLVHGRDCQGEVVDLGGAGDRHDLDLTLEPGGRVFGRALRPDGRPAEQVLLHIGELWSDGTESIVGRVRTDADGHFELAGLPAIGGSAWVQRAGGPAPATRTALFVSCFPPHLLAAAGDRSIEDSPLRNAFVLDDPPLEPLVLTALDSSALRPVQVRPVDSAQRSVRTWIECTLLGATEVREGHIGANLRGALFYSDAVLPDAREMAAVVLRSPDHALAFAHLPEPAGEATHTMEPPVVEVVLHRRPERPTVVIVVDPEGTPCARDLWVGLPFETPGPWLAHVGRSDDHSGRAALAQLAAGRYALFASSIHGPEPSVRHRADAAYIGTFVLVEGETRIVRVPASD